MPPLLVVWVRRMPIIQAALTPGHIIPAVAQDRAQMALVAWVAMAQPRTYQARRRCLVVVVAAHQTVPRDHRAAPVAAVMAHLARAVTLRRILDRAAVAVILTLAAVTALVGALLCGFSGRIWHN